MRQFDKTTAEQNQTLKHNPSDLAVWQLPRKNLMSAVHFLLVRYMLGTEMFVFLKKIPGYNPRYSAIIGIGHDLGTGIFKSLS